MKTGGVNGMILLLLTLGWGTGGCGQDGLMPRGEVRIVDKHPANRAWITYNVFEHLIEVDREGKFVPGLATGWRWLDDR